MEDRYLGHLHYNNRPLFSTHSDNKTEVLVTLLNQLETAFPGAKGLIIDRTSGDVVHSCCMAPIE